MSVTQANPASQEHANSDARIVWLDCDPGHDDAFAIMLAGHTRNRIVLLGISTAAGNQTLEKTTKNALKVLEMSGLSHIDVVPGQAVPLIRPVMVCPEIHGTTGLDCHTEIPAPMKKPLDKKAIIHMFELITKSNEPVTIVATAALTNIALLFMVYPEIKPKIREVVLLGGAIGIGNMAPAAEFNILVDPEAAKVVFESGVKVVMVPLEVSHTALVTPQIIERIRAFKTPFSEVLIDLLMFFQKTYREVFKFEHPPLHDPLAVAYVIAPELFTTELMRVDVEVGSALCAGRTVCDIYHMSTLPKNVHVALKVAVDKFWDLLITSLHTANHHSPLNHKPL